jgi:Tol biopolymer transport system component
MNIIRNLRRWAIGLLGLLMMGLIWTAVLRATPMPPRASIATQETPVQTASPPYPPPGTPEPPLPTLPVQPTFDGAIPPPTWWPTDEPWPAPTNTSAPTSTPVVFPTPDFSPTPTGVPPEQLQRIWFTYLPDSASSPKLRAALVDSEGQRWADDELTIDLGLSAYWPNYPNGPRLYDLIPSPDGQWAAAQIDFRSSVLVNLETGEVRPIILDPATGPGQFFAWRPEGHQAVALPAVEPWEIWRIDVATQEHQQLIDFFRPESEHAQLREIAYSPDGRFIADVMLYSPFIGGRDTWMTEIGLRNGENGERQTLIQLENETFGGLRWSPDATKLIGTASVKTDTGTQVECQLVDVNTGAVATLAILGQNAEYSHPIVWSPGGRHIAFLKIEEVYQGKDVANNLYVLDLDKGTESQITYFIDHRLSYPHWSPDGQWLAFSLSLGGYGEIWLTSLDGTRQYPVAGPTVPNVPVIWLP